MAARNNHHRQPSLLLTLFFILGSGTKQTQQNACTQKGRNLLRDLVNAPNP